ncbi:uncharacterized protein TM35_000061360 [Trypanosoma theileri]|uniref:Uncharacterized protein n=1 Tax=Trypanosoma theileri TaxID=67003 RepID=A0A1X0P2Q2_9TRYP|nr:uncharacterized protein TM35_000061360 [Trypanosoma theileri]ORC91131.1 hypothetical protein TM35_000061360 [Trypanosoma theileri]
MTSKAPSRRLTDILHSNSKETLRRNAAELARVSASLPSTDMQTRFLRNQHLINPKSLHLLCDETILSRWCTFAVYKPPFCPMRRVEADGNFHNVSVESFISAALRSRSVQPILQRELQPKEMKVRVVNNVDIYASGPVIVTIADRHNFSTSLRDFTMKYDVLVAGHATLTEPVSVDAEKLFTFPSQVENNRNKEKNNDNDNTSIGRRITREGISASSLSKCVCTYQVKRNAYYAVHPVSLIEFTITAPPTPLPPQIESFVREHLSTFVLGDPEASATATTPISKEKKKKSELTISTDKIQATKTAWSVVAMRGDCDFPRVFTHLREVNINADVPDVSGSVAAKKKIEFHCRKCFEPILQQERVYSLKGRRIGLLDGSWTPESEFL